MKSILLVLALLFSVCTFANDTIPVKKVPPVKDSAKVETALISFLDIKELETFLNKNVTIENKAIVDGTIKWLMERVQQKAAVYNSKLK